MKTINLVKLELTNYRNIPYQVLEFDGNSKIIGENRIGKTNTLESIIYLFTDKLLNGNSDVSAIKPLSDTKKQVTVEATFSVDGKLHTIKKEYGESWIKRRNTGDLVMEGHYCNYYYDGVKQGTVKAFDKLLAEDFGIPTGDYDVDIKRMLVDPLYLGDLGDSKDWTKLRTFIISLVGDVNETEIYQKEPSLIVIQNDLELCGGRADQLKKKYKTDIDSLKETIKGYEAQINLLEKTTKPTDAEIIVARKAIEEIDTKIEEIKKSARTNDTSFIDLDINNFTAQLNNLKAEKFKELDNNPTQDKIRELTQKDMNLYGEIQKISLNKQSLTNELQSIRNVIERCNETRAEVIKTARELDQPIEESVCPVCGQVMPIEKVVESRNVAKESNHIKGLENKKLLIEKQEEEKKLIAEIDKLETSFKDINKEIESIESEIFELKKSLSEMNPFGDPKIKELENIIEELNQKKAKVRMDNEAFNAELRQSIYEEDSKRSAFKKVLDDLTYYERQMELLNQVEDNKAKTEENLIALESKQDLLKTFIRTKLELLNEHVRLVFENIKFDLIQENINGGFDTVCKPHIINSDVLWKSGSKSEKIMTGIAMADKIKEKLDLPNMPFLFDEGGEISSETFAHKLKTESQLICVKVHDNIDKPTVVKI